MNTFFASILLLSLAFVVASTHASAPAIVTEEQLEYYAEHYKESLDAKDEHDRHEREAEQPPILKFKINQRDVNFISRRAFESQLVGTPSRAFTVDMKFGTPEQTLPILVDTGSGTLGVAAVGNQGGVTVHPFYRQDQSQTAQDTGKPEFSSNYLLGSLTCSRVRDAVTFAVAPPGPTVEFCAIYASEQFFQSEGTFSGILGLAYPASAQPSRDPIEPYFLTFANQMGLPKIFSLQLCDNTESGQRRQGQMTLGGTDSSLRVGDYQYTDILPYPDRDFHVYYMVTVTGMAIGDERLNLECAHYNSPAPAIVDSGTTVLLAPTHIANIIVNTLKQYIDVPDSVWAGNSCVQIPIDILNTLPSISIFMRSSANPNNEFKLTMYPWQYFRTQGSYRCFSVQGGCNVGVSMIIGMVMMTGYDVVHDLTTNPHRLGFATSTCAKSNDNAPLPPPVAAPTPIPNPTDCSPNPDVNSECESFTSTNSSSGSGGKIAGMVVGIVVGAVIIAAIIAIIAMLFKKKPAGRVIPMAQV